MLFKFVWRFRTGSFYQEIKEWSVNKVYGTLLCALSIHVTLVLLRNGDIHATWLHWSYKLRSIKPWIFFIPLFSLILSSKVSLNAQLIRAWHFSCLESNSSCKKLAKIAVNHPDNRTNNSSLEVKCVTCCLFTEIVANFWAAWITLVLVVSTTEMRFINWGAT